MTDEQAATLNKEFPNLYRPYRFDPTRAHWEFSFECSKGWFGIIYDLSVKLEAEIIKLPIEERGQFHADQVKEKFGTLRFYMSSATNEMYEHISVAEEASDITCEGCGKPGAQRDRSWIRVECDECDAKRQN